MTDFEFKNVRDMMFSRIVGCAFRSYNYWHWGVDELVYEAGLVIELEDEGFRVHRQEEFPIYYKDRPTPVRRRMDLVASDRTLGDVVLELKSLDSVNDGHRRQLWSYMRLVNMRFGMLINFGPKGVYSERWELGETDGYCRRV